MLAQESLTRRVASLSSHTMEEQWWSAPHGELDDQVLQCEGCEDVLDLDAVKEEFKLRDSARNLNMYIKGKVNSNEFKLGVVAEFLLI